MPITAARRRLVGACVVTFGAAVLGGCGTAASSPRSTTTAAVEPSPRHNARVGLIEWTIELSATHVRPGRVVLRVTNAGATEHQLTVTGAHGQWHTPDLAPGQTQRLVVRASPGTMRLSSSEPGQVHPMRAELRVVDR